MILEARLSRLLVLTESRILFRCGVRVLSTGFRLRVDRHEANGAQVRLYSNGDSPKCRRADCGFEAEELWPRFRSRRA